MATRCASPASSSSTSREHGASTDRGARRHFRSHSRRTSGRRPRRDGVRTARPGRLRAHRASASPAADGNRASAPARDDTARHVPESALRRVRCRVQRPGPSFTSDTLRELRDLHPQADLFLILGWDAARLFKTWHQPDKVRQLATIVVVARPGSGSPRPADLDAAGLDSNAVILLPRGTPDVSASGIRHDIKEGDRSTARCRPRSSGTSSPMASTFNKLKTGRTTPCSWRGCCAARRSTRKPGRRRHRRPRQDLRRRLLRGL